MGAGKGCNKIKCKYSPLQHRGGVHPNSKHRQQLKCLENIRDMVMKWKITALAGISTGSTREQCEEAAVKIPVSQPGHGFGQKLAQRDVRAVPLHPEPALQTPIPDLFPKQGFQCHISPPPAHCSGKFLQPYTCE